MSRSTVRYNRLPVRMATIKKNPNKQKIASIGKDAERLGPLCIAGRNVKWCSRMESSVEFLQKIENRNTTRSGNATSGYIPKTIESRFVTRYLYTHIHSNIMHNNQEAEGARGSTDERINKLRYIRTTQYYSVLKWRKMPTLPTPWISHEDIILREISQASNDKYRMVSTDTRYLKESSSQRRKAQWWLPGAAGRGE